jgi:ankyrin repeat protein
VVNEARDPPTPLATLLETDSRNPAAKAAILDLYAAHGLVLADTPPMAVHRGRIDRLEAHLTRDPGLLTRRFAFEEIYPPELGCHDAVLATHGTPLGGATLLHMAIDFDEVEIVRWLLAKGMPVDTPAAVDPDGFGGHTALFGTVVAQPNFWRNRRGETGAAMTQLLLAHGADPNARASLRKQMHPGYGPDTLHEYRDVTPLGWGRRFHFRPLVSETALRLIEAAGGTT